MKKCLKKVMDNIHAWITYIHTYIHTYINTYIHVVKETTQTVEKKPLIPMFPYLDSISFQTRIKWKKSLKTS